MCTLTYLPLIQGGYILTQSRDESPDRIPATFPTRQILFEGELVYPRDPQGGGTWMALHSGGRAACIVNGAHLPHKRKSKYKHSRGLIPLQYFEFINPNDFEKNYNCEGLEPFSLFTFENDSIHRFTWDEKTLSHETFDPEIEHIWQSAPLYSPEQQRIRSEWFMNWVRENPKPTHKSIWEWHLSEGIDQPEIAIRMNREVVKTVVISQVRIDKGERITFHDLERGTKRDCILS